MFKKSIKFLRFSIIMAGFIFLLLPFMFFSVVNKGVKKAKNLLGIKSKTITDNNDELFIDNQAWADVPGWYGIKPGCNIHFSYENKSGVKKWFNHISPRTHEVLNLIPVPAEAVLPDGALNLHLDWTRRHHLISLGIIKHNYEQEQKLETEEIPLVEARHHHKGENYAEMLKNKNLNYLHTIQGDEINLVFKEKNGKELKMRIEEREPEESFVDNIKLFKVRHKAAEEVLIDAERQKFYIVPKSRTENALAPEQISVLGRQKNIAEIFGTSFFNYGSGVYLREGDNASVKFGGLKSNKFYSLIVLTKDRGFAPQAKTVFHALPVWARAAALGGAVFVFSKIFKANTILPLSFFALWNGSTPYLSVWDGEQYVLENDVMHSSFGYDPDFKVAKKNYENDRVKPDLYRIKNLKNELPGGFVETYLFSAGGFYTDLRIQYQKPLRNIEWLDKIRN